MIKTTQASLRFLAFTLTLLLLALLPPAAQAQNFAWRIIADTDDILVHQANTPNSAVRTYRGTTVIQLASTQPLPAILNDFKNFPRWFHYISEAKELQRINANESYVRLRMLVPWPAKNREAVLHTMLQHSPATTEQAEQLTYHFQLAEQQATEAAAYRSFKHFTGVIHMQLRGDNEALLSYQIHADPGGRIRPRLSNHMLKSAPYFTLDKLRILLQSPIYKR